MKKVLFIICCALSMTQSALATAQEGNIIFIDGEEWRLLGEPIWADTALYNRMKAILPKDRSWSTANWDGYTSYWSIKQGQLCLDKIGIELYDEKNRTRHRKSIPESQMHSLFKNHMENGVIVGTMFSGKLRLARGRCIYYVHSGYDSSFEYETFLTIDKGRVVARKDYHNGLIEGLSLSNNKDYASFREKFMQRVENLPDINEPKRIIFTIKDVKGDSLGNIKACTVKVRNGSEAIANEMKQYIMETHPWKLLYLYDEYVLPERVFSFVIIKEEEEVVLKAYDSLPVE